MTFSINPPPSRPKSPPLDSNEELTPPLESPTVSSETSPVSVSPSPIVSSGEEQQAPPLPEAAPPPQVEAAPPRRSSDPPEAQRPWPHIIPRILENRQTHILSGSSGAGKTSWVGWFMGQLMSGPPEVLGHLCNRPPFAAYVAADRTIADAIEKLEAGGWYDPPYYSLVDDDSPIAEAYVANLRGGAGQIKRSLTFFQYILKYLQEKYFPSESRIPPDSFLVIDGMAPLFGIEPAGSYLKVAGPLIELSRFCRSWKLNILLVSHSSKQIAAADQRYTRVQDRILGSMALQGFTSTQIFLAEPELSSNPEAGLHELFWRSHSAPAETHEFRRTSAVFDYVGVQWNTLPSPAADFADRPTITAGAVALLPRLSEAEWTCLPILREQCRDLSKTTFYRYIDQLFAANLIERDEKPGTHGSKLVFVRRRKPDTSD